MMKTCEQRGCNQWAQWAALYPPLDRGPMKLWCTIHKQDEEKKNIGIDKEDDKIKFLFCGAIPNGFDHTKYRPYFERKPKVGRVFVEGAGVPEPSSASGTGRESDVSPEFRQAVEQVLRSRKGNRRK